MKSFPFPIRVIEGSSHSLGIIIGKSDSVSFGCLLGGYTIVMGPKLMITRQDMEYASGAKCLACDVI